MSNDKLLATILGILTLLGVLYKVGDGWYGLQYRVQRLEEHERFSHGDIGQFMKEK